MNRSSARTNFEIKPNIDPNSFPRSFRILGKSVNIVAKMTQILDLGEVWAALGAYQGVFVVSWASWVCLAASWVLLRASWGRLGRRLGRVLGASWGLLGVPWGNFKRPLGRPGEYWRVLKHLGDVLGSIFVAKL